MHSFARPIVVILALVGSLRSVAAVAWDPIPVDERRAISSSVDPEAGAEILWRDEKIESRRGRTVHEYHVRLKVYTAQGVRELDKIDLHSDAGEMLSAIEARIVKPDGTEVRIDADDVYSRDVVRAPKARLKQKSFALPGLEPGDIIEYRYRETTHLWYGGLILYVQGRWPTRAVRVRIKLTAWFPGQIRMITHKCREQKQGKDRSGFLTFEERDLPALDREPHGPPPMVANAWVMVDVDSAILSGESIWKRRSRAMDRVMKADLRGGAKVRARAAALVEGATADTEKLRRLYEYCRTCVRETRDTTADPRPPTAVMAAGEGDSREVNGLMIALARELGFDARPAQVVDRSQRFFSRLTHDSQALPDGIVAIRRDQGWEFFDPGAAVVAFGSLRWQNESVAVLIADAKQELFAHTPETPARNSTIQRQARLRLDADGAVAGEIDLVYTGHPAVEMRLDLREADRDGWRQIFRDEAAERLGAVEVNDVTVEHLDDPAQPLRVNFSIKATGYAERAGRRLFVQPAFFQKGQAPIFEAETRRHDVYFHYAWFEEDSVGWIAPEGFTLEQGAAPEPVATGDALLYHVQLAWTPAKRAVHFTRKFRSFQLLFDAATYPALKQALDAIRLEDAHTITLLAPEEPAAAGNES